MKILLISLLSAAAGSSCNAAETNNPAATLRSEDEIVQAVFATAKPLTLTPAVHEVMGKRIFFSTAPLMPKPATALTKEPRTVTAVFADRPPAITNLPGEPRHGVLQIETIRIIIAPRGTNTVQRTIRPSLAAETRTERISAPLPVATPYDFWDDEETQFKNGARFRLGPIESPFDRRDAVPPRFGFTLRFPLERKRTP